jgi:hypothetical protein
LLRVLFFVAVADESARFADWLCEKAKVVRKSFDEWLNRGGTSGSPGDPNNMFDKWRRVNHTLKHAKEWFGTKTLTPSQIEEWGRVLQRAASSTKTFASRVGVHDTVAHLARIDNKYIVVHFYRSTGDLCTAFVPNARQLAEALRATGH